MQPFIEVSPRSPTDAARDLEMYRTTASRSREHCPACGRFAKPGRPPQMDMNGEYPYTVWCKTHGEMWIV